MFYEVVLLIRPQVSTKQIAVVLEEFRATVEKSGGKSLEGEYWGFLTLTYRMDNRWKAHYVCLGIETPVLKHLEFYLKFHSDILRHMIIKKPEGLRFPTPLFYSSLEEIGKLQERPEGVSNNSWKDEGLDYKNIKLLKRHLTESGKIIPARLTNLSRGDQNLVNKSIKRARELGLLPYLVN